jgi:hypothetical protein
MQRSCALAQGLGVCMRAYRFAAKLGDVDASAIAPANAIFAATDFLSMADTPTQTFDNLLRRSGGARKHLGKLGPRSQGT